MPATQPTPSRVDQRGRTVVVLGGTDGIGAATALEFRARGADVVIIGRSPEKAARVVGLSEAMPAPGTLQAITTDLSLMRTVETTVAALAERIDRIDVLVQTVGILISRTAHTEEGIELDFAVGYLARFAFLEHAHRRHLLHDRTRLLNVAGSAPKVPGIMRMDLGLAEVEKRVGMRSHGQTQLANEILTALAPQRYGVTALGYGPGSVRTEIRREIPRLISTIMKPIFHFATREPGEVATELVDAVTSPTLEAGVASFRNRRGAFPADPYITDSRRQQQLIDTSTALLQRCAAHGGSSR